MTTAPTQAEIMRRLDEVVVRLDRMAAALEEGYVRKDVQTAREAATNLQLKGFEDELHVVSKRLDSMDERAQKASFARWSIGFSALIGPVLVVVLLHAMGLLAAAK